MKVKQLVFGFGIGLGLAKTPGADIGAKVMLNYVGCHPYFNRGEDEIKILKRLFMQAKRMK